MPAPISDHAIGLRHSQRIANAQAAVAPAQQRQTRRKPNATPTTKQKSLRPSKRRQKDVPATPSPLPQPHPISPETDPFPSVKATRVTQKSPPPHDQADPATEVETRVEIPFAKFERVVFEQSFASQSAATALRRVSRSAALGSEWSDALAAYRDTFYTDRQDDGSFLDSEIKCLDLLNVASKAGVNMMANSDRKLFRTPLEYVRRQGESVPPPVSPSLNHAPTSEFTTPSDIDSTFSCVSVIQSGHNHIPVTIVTPPGCIGVPAPALSNDELSWAGTAVVLQIHTRVEAPDHPQPLKPESRKRRSSDSPDSTGSNSKRLRLNTSKNPSNFVNVPQPPTSPDQVAFGPKTREEEYETEDGALDAYVSDVLHLAANRRHIYGIHVSGLHIRFYYYDRVGVIKTTPLHLESDARLIISTLLRLQTLDAFQLGVEPFFHPRPVHPRSSRDLFSSVVGQVVEVEGRRFKITDVISSSFSRFGRGTTVYGAALVGDGKGKERSQKVAPSPPTRVAPNPTRKSARISAQRKNAPSKQTRGAPLDDGATVDPNESLVLKMSWQLRSRHSEDDFLRLAAAEGVEGVIRLYGATTVECLSDGARGRLVRTDEYHDRELRIQVLGPRCSKLKNVKDVEHFKTAFRSLVQGELDSLGLFRRLILTSPFQPITIFTSKRGLSIATLASRILWLMRATPVVAYWSTLISRLGSEMGTDS